MIAKKRKPSQERWLLQRKKMREDFLAGKVCDVCGGQDSLLITWQQMPGPMAVSKLWQTRQEVRDRYLPLVRVRCRPCKNKQVGDALRGEHGGGTQGIGGCRCALCRAARSKYNTQWQRRKRLRLKALQELPKANGS